MSSCTYYRASFFAQASEVQSRLPEGFTTKQTEGLSTLVLQAYSCQEVVLVNKTFPMVDNEMQPPTYENITVPEAGMAFLSVEVEEPAWGNQSASTSGSFYWYPFLTFATDARLVDAVGGAGFFATNASIVLGDGVQAPSVAVTGVGTTALLNSSIPPSVSTDLGGIDTLVSPGQGLVNTGFLGRGLRYGATPTFVSGVATLSILGTPLDRTSILGSSDFEGHALAIAEQDGTLSFFPPKSGPSES
jgi:hypothetical protein